MKTRSHPRHLTLKLSGVALALAALQTPALAVDYVWNGSYGFWDESAKWSLLGVPGSGDSATVNGTGTNTLVVRDPRSVDTLYMNGGNLAATSTLTVGMLNFGSGKFGSTAAQAGGVMNVTGSAVFNGSENQGVDYSHVVNLGGNASWTQGNGRLSVATSYSQGSQSFASAVLNIGAGTVFTDEGAASASGYKQLGGGTVNNSGTYVRRGLGETFAQSVNNTGTIDIRSGTFSFYGNGNASINNSSSGQILVASGTTLKLDSVNFTGGSVVNNGLVRQYAGTVVLGAGVQIGGAWQIDAGRMTVQGTHTIDSLVMSGTDISGPGTLNTGSLVFNYGKFGSTSSQGGGVMNVTGSAVFNGSENQGVDYSHVLNLGGNASWTQGNGRLSVATSYSQGSQSFASAVLNIGAGTVFTDEGAATASAYKQIGGGTVNNSGTYVRRGLGETFATSFNNTGTIDVQSGTFSLAGNGNASINNSSSGQILVASGSTLKLDSVNFTGGSVVNNGLVRQYAGTVVLGAGVQIGGAWQIDAGRMTVQGTHTIDSLVMSGTDISGPGTLNTGSLVFNYGKFGSTSSQGGGVMNVTGSAVFDGTQNQGVDYSHVLNLAGSATWTQGNGRLTAASAYSQGSQTYAAAALNIGTGTVFTDAGAANAAGTKTAIGLSNAGTYVRSGAGTTEATGFNNTGSLQIVSGTFSVDDRFSNTGQVDVAAGAQLSSYRPLFANAGLLTGAGTVKTYRATDALLSSGTIDPGTSSAAPAGLRTTLGAAGSGFGTLTIDGGLSLTDSAVLHIDLGANGASDLLAVTGSALWNGELSIWATPGTSLQLGETFTIATAGQRLSNSSFDSISWHGLSAGNFAIDYTANGITLRVTAVPEPASYALLSLGLLVIGARKWRRQIESTSTL